MDGSKCLTRLHIHSGIHVTTGVCVIDDRQPRGGPWEPRQFVSSTASVTVVHVWSNPLVWFTPSTNTDILLNLSDVAPDLQNSISLLCERWWLGELEDRDGLVPNCLLYMVARTLADGATVGES